MIAKKLAPILLLTAAVMFGAVLYVPQVAEAGGLKAKIFMVQKRIPKKLTEKGLIRFAQSNRAKLLREDRSGEIKKRKWKGEMVISFNRGVGDLEFQVLFYDIHDGPRRFVQDLAIFVNDRKQKTFVNKFTLPRPDFKPNRNMELVVTVKRQEVGRQKFGLIGEEIKRSGEVSFSDDER